MLVALTVSTCLFGADRRLTLKRSPYPIAAGEIIPLEFGQSDREFARTAREIRADMAGGGPKVAIGKDELTGDVFLAAPLTILPGTYTVTVSAKQANGEERVGAAQVEVTGLKPVQISARRPVILLNGFQTGLLSSCPASTSRGIFGDLEDQLYLDGVPRSVIFFDNCRECPDCYIEELGAALGTVLSRLRYTDGTPVGLVDVVAHSMGGLIVRSYLSGKRTVAGVFTPPGDTKIGKLVLIGTPNFGAGMASLTLGFGTQAPDMRLGSRFLWDLATWNQGTDDLRETDALAIAGSGGFSGGRKGASDGVVALTSASLAFSGAGPERTRVVPYFTPALFG